MNSTLNGAAKILRDRHSWYVTFRIPDAARRAALFITAMGSMLGNHPVTVTARPPPTHVPIAYKTHWTNAELIDQAEKMIMQDLRALLEKDITERMVAPHVRGVVHEESAKKGVRPPETATDSADHPQHDTLDAKYIDRTDLRGLSFRKQKKRLREEPVVVEPTPAPPEPHEDEVVVVEPPKKKKRVPKKPVVEEKVIESEDEEAVVFVPPLVPQRKRAMSDASDIEVPVKKKSKGQQQQTVEDAVAVPLPRTKKLKKPVVREQVFEEELVHEVLPDTLAFEPPSVTQLRVKSLHDTPSPLHSPIVPSIVLHDAPKIDPLAEGICEDEEDMYFARLALERVLFGKAAQPPEPEPDPDAPVTFRKHQTGSARTEGYYKISHTEKSAYVAQYQLRNASATAAAQPEHSTAPPKQTVGSSRANRANARRRAQGLEEMNQVQRAMALSKGEAAAPDSIKYNQLQARKKQLRFSRSPIHDWGLYAMEKINRGDLVIEYVGEVIRAQVADKREKAYERQGIGSSYLFRIDEDLVVDATKKGNLGYVAFRSLRALIANARFEDGSSTIHVTPTARRKSSRLVGRRRSLYTPNRI